LLQSEKVIQVLRAHQQKVKEDKIKEIQERKIKKEQEPKEAKDQGNQYTQARCFLPEAVICRLQVQVQVAGCRLQLQVASVGCRLQVQVAG